MKETVKNVVDSFEKYLRYHKVDLKKIDLIQNLFVVKTINHKKKQFTVYEAFEDPKVETFMIRARNTFLSHGNF